jgi:hypothetical protein
MKPKHILLYIFLLSFTSCVVIVKWKYGITNPREQTPEKLISFLERHKYPDSCIFIFNDSLSYFQGFRNSVFRKHLLNHLIFDCKGSLLQRDTAKCQWSGYDVIKALNPDSAYLKNNGLQLADILDHISPIGPNPGLDTVMQHPDFTIIVTWAKFLGDYNSRLFVLSEAVEQNKTARIRLIWLNIDMQESWKLTPEQKLAIK